MPVPMALVAESVFQHTPQPEGWSDTSITGKPALFDGFQHTPQPEGWSDPPSTPPKARCLVFQHTPQPEGWSDYASYHAAHSGPQFQHTPQPEGWSDGCFLNYHATNHLQPDFRERALRTAMLL